MPELAFVSVFNEYWQYFEQCVDGKYLTQGITLNIAGAVIAPVIENWPSGDWGGENSRFPPAPTRPFFPPRPVLLSFSPAAEPQGAEEFFQNE